MRFLEILQVALSAIRASKLRSFLTALGIVIGTGAVITMIALGSGAQAAVERQLEALGTDLLSVTAGQAYWRGVASAERVSVTSDDALALQRDARTLRAVVPSLDSRMQVKLGDRNANIDVIATTAAFASVHRLRIATGRFFTEGDDRARSRVAVLGAEVLAEELEIEIADPAEVVGQQITIRGIPFEVIGVLELKGTGGRDDPDETVFIPFRTGEYRLFGTDRLGEITVQMRDPGRMDASLLEIETIMRREHRLRPDQPNDFRIRDRSQFLTARAEASKTLTFLLAGIAAVSLIVGGIGIMNIMLVSVTQRTREIGIRKALGATRANILLQFLVEALTLCILGGLVGLLAGWGAAVFFAQLNGWSVIVTAEAIALAVGFSVAVGIFFGVWPARQAAQLDPIEALRYE
jgi:putative ABC transport system permease protein